MTQILVVGHGGLATALLETARMLIGTTGQAQAVSFPVGMGVDELAAQVSSAVDALQADSTADTEATRVLILADVVGGSPARAALGEAVAGRAEVVAGVNLPMVIDALFSADNMGADELARKVMVSAQAGIRNLGSEIRQGGGPA